MSHSQPQHSFEIPLTDSTDCIDIYMDGLTAPIDELSPQERLELRRVVDSYSVEPEKLRRVNHAAQLLGRPKAELIREGLDLVLEKYHDQLGDLDNAPPPEQHGERPL